MGRAGARAFLAAAVQRLRAERPDEDEWGDPLPKMRLEGDVAIIPIVGSLAINLLDWIKAYGIGLTDINDIAEELSTATADPRTAFLTGQKRGRAVQRVVNTVRDFQITPFGGRTSVPPIAYAGPCGRASPGPP